MSLIKKKVRKEQELKIEFFKFMNGWWQYIQEENVRACRKVSEDQVPEYYKKSWEGIKSTPHKKGTIGLMKSIF